MTLIQCIYCSAATAHDFTLEELNAILDVSRRNNARLNVTGVLLSEAGSFFQILEGDANVVDELFQKIQQDPRHSDVRLIISEPIEARCFADWSMGHPNLTMADIEAIPGLNDFFHNGYTYMNMENETTRTLLESYRKGHWRV